MESNIVDKVQEYKNTVDKINDHLLSLKTELLAMRKQDVKLLKQLITVHDIIQTFCQKCVEYSTCRDLNFNTTGSRPTLVRQQSVPFYCGALLKSDTLNSSIGSSFEGIEEIPEDDLTSEDGEESIYSLSGGFPVNSCQNHMVNLRPSRSMSYEVRSENDHEPVVDGKLEDILKRNIELWKFSNKEILSIPNVQYSEQATTFSINSVD